MDSVELSTGWDCNHPTFFAERDEAQGLSCANRIQLRLAWQKGGKGSRTELASTSLGRTKHDLRIEIVLQVADKLRLNGQLVSEHAQVVRQLGMLR